jgi:hypothetical protein
MIRRDLEEIKEMLIPEVTPTKEEIRAIQQGRKEFARGEFVEWKEVKKKKRAKRAVSWLYHVVLTKRAIKGLDRAPEHISRKANEAIEALEESFAPIKLFDVRHGRYFQN